MPETILQSQNARPPVTDHPQKFDKVRKQLGARIQLLRREKGLSQEALAEFSDLSLDSIYKIEYGRVNTSLENLLKIAGALGLTVSGLLQGFKLIRQAHRQPSRHTVSRTTTSNNNSTLTSQETRKALGQKIKKLRLEKGWSQTKMAEIGGMNDGHIGEIERGEIDACLSTLAKIAATFKTSVADLFEGVL